MGYEYLIAGLEDIALGQKPKLSLQQLIDLLHEQLTESDFNLILLLQKTNNDPSLIQLFQEDSVQDRFHETTLSENDFRTQLLYEEGCKSKNKFVREWFEFNLNLNNVLAAAICQKHKFDIDKVIVGNNEVAQTLRKNGVGKNSNLAVLLPELKEIIALTDIDDLLQREKHIDALRWQWIEDNALFNYFDTQAVIAYYLKATILHRWDELSKEKGEEVFRNLINDMKKDIKF